MCLLQRAKVPTGQPDCSSQPHQMCGSQSCWRVWLKRQWVTDVLGEDQSGETDTEPNRKRRGGGSTLMLCSEHDKLNIFRKL